MEKQTFKILKYRLGKSPGIHTTYAPWCGTLLHCGLDPHNELCIWMHVDVNQKSFDFPYLVAHTGEEVDPNLPHIATVCDGGLVLHVFRAPISDEITNEVHQIQKSLVTQDIKEQLGESLESMLSKFML